jgi:hypothetical protein
MKKQPLNQQIPKLRFCIIALILVTASLSLLSFQIKKMNEEFLNQLGIAKVDADKKIIDSFIGGSLDAYGLKNAKNIALNNRASVAKELLIYAKKQVNSPSFISQYKQLKESHKPEGSKMQTPDEMQKGMIDNYRKSVQGMEETVKKADAQYKPLFQKSLDEARKQLKQIEDPNNEMYVSYRQNYDQAIKSLSQSNQKLLADWENEYPNNHLLFVKKRLQQFLEETNDVDFEATTIMKNGKKIFEKREYESKGRRWKMAYRAGKEVVGTSRVFVQQWVNEIK